MSPLAWFLACVTAATVTCALLGIWTIESRRFASVRWPRYIIIVFVIVMTLLTGGMVRYFVGWSVPEAYVPRAAQRRIAHAGYYFARDGEFKLVGDKSREPAIERRLESSAASEREPLIRQLLPSEFFSDQEQEATETIAQGFMRRGLAADDSLSLKPVWTQSRANEWDFTYRITDRPLRIYRSDDRSSRPSCINVPPDQWFDDGDSLFIERENGDQSSSFVTIKWQSGKKYFWPISRITNTYYFSAGTVHGATRTEVLEKGPILMSDRIVSDGITLDRMLRRTNATFYSQIGNIDEDWWTLFRDIILTREESGNRSSRLGFLINDAAFRTAGVRIYKKSESGALHPIPGNRGPSTMRISTTTVISFGFAANQDHFDLQLPSEATKDPVWGQVMRVMFSDPDKWPLTPETDKEFIIASTSDYIPLDGYVVDIGDSAHPFYAKAKMGSAFDEMFINDGRNLATDEDDKPAPRRFALNEMASLGDYDQGILLVLRPSQSDDRPTHFFTTIFGSLRKSGRAAIILITINALTFLLLWHRQGQGQRNKRLFLTWTLLWGLISTILTVRFLLAFRVSLIPPLDSTLNEVRGVFDKGVDFGLFGLLGLAAINCILSFAYRRSKRRYWKTWLVILLVIVWGVIVEGYALIGGFFGSNQSLGLRINIGVHLLALLGLAILIKPILESRSVLAEWLAIIILVLAVALQALVVKDAGAVIYSGSLLVPVFVIVGWNASRHNIANQLSAFVARHRILRRPLRRIGGLVPAIAWRISTVTIKWGFPVLVAASPIVLVALGPYLNEKAVRKVVAPALPNTAFYRLASYTDTEDVILTARSGEETVDMSKLLENSQQNWQMLLYASHGASAPTGYGGTPSSHVGMTYSTSVSDCAFATYLLAEHGKMASLLVLLMYQALGFACLGAGFCFEDTVRHRSVVLIAVGSFFIFNSIYMAGANVGLFPFTGQNIPLLGLNSGGDLLQGLILIALAGWLLLRTATDVRADTGWRRAISLSRWSLAVLLAGIAMLSAVTLRMIQVGENESYRSDHALKKEILDQVKADLPSEKDESKRNAPLVLKGETIEGAQGASLMEIEEQYRKQFNDRIDKYNPNGGLYYLEKSTDSSGRTVARVRVNARFIFARSPFDNPITWHGEIVTGAQREPTLYGTHKKRVTISLRDRGYPGSIDLADERPVRTTFATQVREGQTQFCELLRDHDRLSLDPKDGDWAIFVDGKRLKSREAVDLAPLSIIVIERGKNYRRNLIYLGSIHPVLAYSRWRNGQQRRLFSEGSFGLADLIGKAADITNNLQINLPPNQQRLGNQITLTVDLDLQRSLEQLLMKYAKSHSAYSPFKPSPNRLAVTVMDAFNGRVLALGSWPSTDLTKKNYANIIDQLPEPVRSRFEDNNNLTRHVVGSTVKPIVLSTMATALWPTRDLARFKIYNRPSSYAGKEPVVHPHLQLGGLNIDLWDCNSITGETDMRNFLVHSLDYPEGVLGMLGMVKNADELNRVLRRDSGNHTTLAYDGADYTLNLMLASEDGSAFSLQDQREGKLPTPRGEKAVNDTILYRGLMTVFDFCPAGTADERLAKSSMSFFPTFYNPLLNSKNTYLDNIIAYRLDLGGGDFQGIRQGFLSCVLGGEPCGFNNVMMAEAASRIAIGKRVFAHLEEVGPTDSPDLPLPLSTRAWRNNNLVDPMEMVGRTGTGAEMYRLVSLPRGYRALYKTGTIVEGNEGRESEALMFVVGKWQDEAFVPELTVSGFLYMEKSKEKERTARDGDMKKFHFAAPILNRIVEYLESSNAH